MSVQRKVARDFSDRILQEKYENELYTSNIIKGKIHQLKEYMNFYIIAALWMVAIIIFPKFCIVIMAIAMYLTYKLDCLNEKYFYHIGVMFVLTSGYVLSEFVVFAPFVVMGVLFVIITIVYVIAAVVSIFKYYIFTQKRYKFITDFWGRYHLGTQLYECNEKLYRLESELLARKKAKEEKEFLEDSSSDDRGLYV